MVDYRSSQRSQGPKHAAVYCRVSTVGQAEDGTSLDTQEARCRDYVKDRGYSLAGVWSDRYSGAQYRERPGLSQLREAVRSGAVDVVLAFALDRLSRNQAHLYILAEEIEQAGARLEFVTEDFEDSSVGRFIRSAKAFAAEVEREKLSERTNRGRLARVQSGKIMPGCKPRYGYHWNADRTGFDIDPATAPVVERIYREALAGVPLRSIAAGLTNDGISTPKGGDKWSFQTVRFILADPVYAGDAIAWRWEAKRTRNGKASGRLREDTTAHVALPEGTAPAIVSPDEFNGVQARLAKNKQQAPRNSKNPEASLLRAGFVRCGICGRSMVASITKNRPHGQYRCHANGHVVTIGVPKLDAIVWGKVEEILSNPEIIAEELERMRDADPMEGEFDRIAQGIKEIERKQRNLTQQLVQIDDPDAGAPIRAELESLAKGRQQLLAEQDQIIAARNGWEQARSQLASLETWCQDIAARLDNLTYENKRLALEALNIEVQVWPESHSERYKIRACVPLDTETVSTTPRDSRHNHLILQWTNRDIVPMAAD